jgi:hypothetical protein
MARRTFDMVDIIEILVHWPAGRSKGEIAQSLGVDRKTAGKLRTVLAFVMVLCRSRHMLAHRRRAAPPRNRRRCHRRAVSLVAEDGERKNFHRSARALPAPEDTPGALPAVTT